MTAPTTTQLLKYRPYTGPFRGTSMAMIAIARASLKMIARRKLFWGLYIISLLIFLFYFFGQYLMVFLENRVNESMVRTGGVFGRTLRPDFLVVALREALHMDGSADTYGDFMWTEGYIAMVILAFTASLIVGNDFLHKSLPFFLSKPIDRHHYLVGKFLAIAVIINLMTTVPALALYVEYGFVDEWHYYYQKWRLLLGILAYGAGLTASLGLLLLVTATWLKKTVPLVMVWTGLFVMSRLVQRWLVDGLSLSPRWRLIDLWNNVYLFGQWVFGLPHEQLRPKNMEQPAYWEASVAMLVCIALCLLYLRKKVRAFEVIS